MRARGPWRASVFCLGVGLLVGFILDSNRRMPCVLLESNRKDFSFGNKAVGCHRIDRREIPLCASRHVRRSERGKKRRRLASFGMTGSILWRTVRVGQGSIALTEEQDELSI